MTTYGTGNPVGSPDPRDLYDNAENLDDAMNTTDSVWTDRFGVTRKTFKAAENAADDAEAAANNAITTLIPAEVQRAADYVETVLEPDTADALDMSVAKSAMRAESARDAAFVNADVYGDIAAGLAGTADGEQFQVVEGDEIVRYRRVDATTSEEVARYPASVALDDIYRERLMARKAEWLNRQQQLQGRPKAAVVVLLGQSNNAVRGNPISGVVSDRAYMPIGGNSITYYDFFSLNATHVMYWTDVASSVQHSEGGGETPCSGVAIGLLGGQFERVYIASAAIGARSLDTLRSGGPVANACGLVQRMCDFARADGYEPLVMFDTHHGEADGSAGATEQEYYNDGYSYYRQMQAFAANAMGEPSYSAPVVFHLPIIGFDGYRNVASAILRLSKDLENGMMAGGSYQFPTEPDRIHQEEEGYRMRGEQAGFILRDYFDEHRRYTALHISEAHWSGTTAQVIFNREVMQDTAVDYGTNLSTDTAELGIEFLDDGTAIAIASAVVNGRTVTLTLATTPTGTQQVVRIASQQSSSTLVSGSAYVPGTQLRATSTTRYAIYDPSFTIGDFATPQNVAARENV